jgi:hypothetical protein
MRLHTQLATLCLLGIPALAAESRAANKTVCVQVQVREPAPSASAAPARPVVPAAAPEAPSPGDTSGLTVEQRRIEELRAVIQAGRGRAVGATAVRPPSAGVPVGFEPIDYLKRLLEHFITHERGFTAVPAGCQERFDVELYPLSEGWTAFARYSGTGREERVDQLFPDELSQFAERAALALLYGRPISATLLRDTVLRSDSRRVSQRVRGTNHFELKLGTGLRGGRFPTAQSDGTVSPEIRVWSPVNLALGYRGRFESWGMEVTGNVDIGTTKTGIAQNPTGGHIDFGGDAGMSLHFLRYTNPRGITSLYLGAGTTFGLQWLTTVLPREERGSSDRRTWLSGGLDVDLLIGTEFMRASRAQFLLQGMLHLPAYVVNQEDRLSRVLSWMPGLTLQLGVMF